MTPTTPTPALLELLRRRAGLLAVVRPRPRSRFEDEQPGELRVIDEDRIAPDLHQQRTAAPSPVTTPRPLRHPDEAPRPDGSSPARTLRSDEDMPGERQPVARSPAPVDPAVPGTASPPTAPPQRPQRAGPNPADSGNPRVWDRGPAPVTESPSPSPGPVPVAPSSDPPPPRATQAQPLAPRSRLPFAAAPEPPVPPVGTSRTPPGREEERRPAASPVPVVEVRIGRIVVDARPIRPASADRGGVRRVRGRAERPGPDLETYLSGRDASAATGGGR